MSCKALTSLSSVSGPHKQEELPGALPHTPIPAPGRQKMVGLRVQGQSGLHNDILSRQKGGRGGGTFLVSFHLLISYHALISVPNQELSPSPAPTSCD